MSVRIIIGDVRERLRDLPDESAHCVVTSPPYFGLRDYGVAGQIGLETTPATFVEVMVDVFREVRRVLRSDGIVFLNLGDSYWTSGQRQTGRNDTARETPGGRGDSFRGGERRAIACDTAGRVPEDFQAHGCFCQSLCGVCREAYRIGRVHSGRLLDPMPPSSSSSSSREHRESPSGHAPTSGSTRQDDRSSAATQDRTSSPTRARAPLRAYQASMLGESSLQLQGDCHQSAPPSECRLCARSLADCAPASVRTEACICGTTDGASADRTTDMDVLGSARVDCTTTSRLKPKDLIGIPWRVAFALQADGWWLRQDIIWSKPNPMPESITDRCTKAHEYLFLLSKSERYYYDAAAVREDSDWTPGNTKMPDGWDTGPGGHGSFHRDGREKGRRVRGVPPRHAAYESSDQSALDAVGRGAGRNRRSVWTIATQPFKEAHFATFPPALVEPCILAGCPKGGTVLDPFLGAGTTALVADRLGRNCIGVELNPEYAAIAERRIRKDSPMFADVVAA